MRQQYFYLPLVAVLSGVCAAASGRCVPSPSVQAKLQSQPKASAYAEAGMWYSGRGQYECAAEAYRSALKQQPKSANLLYLLGLSLMRQGEVHGAVEPLQQSVDLDPSVLKPHLLLATALDELRREAEARSQWLAALKVDPHSEMALDGASKNYLAAGEFDSVMALLGPQPKGETLTLDLALACRGAGNTDQAIEVLKKGIEATPSSLVLRRELITSLALQGHYEEGVKLGEDLVRRAPSDLDGKILYLHLLVLSDDEQRGRPLAKKLLAAAPNNFGVLYLNGLLENKSGNYGAGRTFLEKAVSLNPDHSDSRYNLGIALANLNEPQKAREQLEKALAIGATEPGVRSEYAKVLRTLGETALAAEQIKLYQQEQKAKADRTLAASKMAQADNELESGDAKKAAQLYRDGIAALPDYAPLQYKLSVALDRDGDIEGERRALEKAIELDPRMANAHRQLGYLAFNGGDFATAEAHFRQAVEAAPGFTDAWVSLAATLASQSRTQEAEQAVKRALEIDPQNANAIDLQKEIANATGQTRP